MENRHTPQFKPAIRQASNLLDFLGALAVYVVFAGILFYTSGGGQ